MPQEVLDSLPENQGHPVRHRCAACAYEAGLNEASADIKALIEQVRVLTEENERLNGARAFELPRDHAPNGLLDEYPDSEFKNLTRSTIALLAYWRTPETRLRFLAEELGAPDLVNAVITPEFPTPSMSGKASFTDLLVESSTTAIAIEGKRNEGRYASVADWRGDSDNRRRVLDHWCSLIRRRAAFPEDTTLDALVYQMIHRTASACARPAERAIVLYQIFNQKHLATYETDLRALVTAIQPSPRLEFWIHVITPEHTEIYSELERTLAGTRDIERPALVRAALARQDLFRFADVRLTRVA